PCMPSKPVGIFELQGTADINIPFNGGLGCGVSGTNFTSVPVTIQTWIDNNNCTCPFANEATCGQVTLTDGDGTCTQFGTCAHGGNVTLCIIDGGGHSWAGSGPGQFAGLGNSCNKTIGTFQASQNIWNFFASVMDGTSSPSSGGQPSTSSSGTMPMTLL